MKATIEENGDLLFENSFKSRAYIGLLIGALFISLSFYFGSWRNISWLSILVYSGVILICWLLTRMDIHSICRFKASESIFEYHVQSFGFYKKGAASIDDIQEIVTQESSDGDREYSKRFAVVLGKKTIPLYLDFKYHVEHEKIRETLNEWLRANSHKRLFVE